MNFLGSFLLIFCHRLSQALSAPVDIVIVQIQQRRVLGDQQVVDQVLLNGVSFTSTDPKVKSIMKTISADSILPALISINQTSSLINHTILRSRECFLEGSQLHWTDQVFCDGQLYLTLDHNGTWTTHLPEAAVLAELWEQEAQGTRTEMERLREGCSRLMTALSLSQSDSVSVTFLLQFLIPILALLIFSTLMITSILISKQKGLRHPGGVIGSIIHYSQDLNETEEKKGDGYQML